MFCALLLNALDSNSFPCKNTLSNQDLFVGHGLFDFFVLIPHKNVKKIVFLVPIGGQ